MSGDMRVPSHEDGVTEPLGSQNALALAHAGHFRQGVRGSKIVD